MPLITRLLKLLGYILYLLLSVYILMELFLRIYNPFPSRLRGDKITLPVKESYRINNTGLPDIDAEVIHTKNALGFRGPDKPADLTNHLSVITIGGSTTECYYNSDTKTWPYLLGQTLKASFPNIWLNNAGLNGHSTFGHQILLDDHVGKLKPDVVLFLVGCNDVERTDLNNFDKRMVNGQYDGALDFLVEHSEFANLLMTARRAWRARAQGIGHDYVNLTQTRGDTMPVPAEVRTARLAGNVPLANAFKQRLRRLVTTCKRQGIKPVLITQPTVYGAGIDPKTGVDLAKVHLQGNLSALNGALYWEILELYNQKTREVSKENQVFAIDLARELPKNSAYFFDVFHYTNTGCREVARIIAHELTPYLAQEYKGSLASK